MSHFSTLRRVSTNVYVDGFNLFYGCVKGTAWKWLDFDALARVLLRGHTIGKVKYFTSRVDDRRGDPNQSQRQDVYVRASRTLPTVELYFGEFRTNIESVRLARRFRTAGAGSEAAED